MWIKVYYWGNYTCCSFRDNPAAFALAPYALHVILESIFPPPIHILDYNLPPQQHIQTFTQPHIG
ncbi:hypothetical protein WA026_005664, partial [Henosepilachna vigintioctopunctata]